MPDELTIISELGAEADLLIYPDAWLESKRTQIEAEIFELSHNLNLVIAAQRHKLNSQSLQTCTMNAYPSAWLENRRIYLQQKISELTSDLDVVITAQRLKTELQQQNMVALRCVEKCDDAPSDVIVRIFKLTDALTRLEQEKHDSSIPHDIANDNARQQLKVWEQDGYDIATTSEVAKRVRRHGPL